MGRRPRNLDLREAISRMQHLEILPWDKALFSTAFTILEREFKTDEIDYHIFTRKRLMFVVKIDLTKLT